MYKKVLGVTLAAVMTFSAASGMASAKSNNIYDAKVNEDTVICYAGNTTTATAWNNGTVAEFNEDYYKNYTFKDFSQGFKKGLSKEILKKAETLFNKATKLEKEQKFEEATKVWNELEKLNLYDFSGSEFAMKDYTFKEFSQQFKKNVDKATLKKAEDLFNKAMALDKAGKYDEAAKVWDQLYKLDIYDYDMKSICTLKDYTFKEFSQQLKKDLDKTTLTKVESLFNKAVKLEKDGKVEEAMKLWDQIYKMDIFNYEGISVNYEDFKFEDFAKSFKQNIDKATLKKAEQLYDKALKLEKDGKFEESNKVWDELYKLDLFEKVEMSYEPFEEFAKSFKDGVSKQDIAKAKELYKQAIKLEKENKFDEANTVWDKLYNLKLFPFEVYEAPTFEEFAKEFKKDVSKQDLAKAKELYNKIVKLEKDGKYDESTAVWQKLYDLNILDICD